MRNLFLPTFSFYREWYWWLLMLIVLVSAYIQGVGFNLESQSGASRNQFGKMYKYSVLPRPLCWLAMFFISGWVSVVASIVGMFAISIGFARVTRRHACLILEQASDNPVAIQIPILVEVELAEGWGGERWNVLDVIDKRDGQSIGEIDVAGFNAYSDFTEALKLSVLRSLQESEEFSENKYYCLSLSIRDGGSEIGWSTDYFWGREIER
jgi:hypothetical protein